MPLQGVLCDDTGDPYSFEECIGCALAGGPRRCHNPLPLLVAMSKNAEERADAGISATMLLDCPRKIILARENDYFEKPSAYWARFRGTIGHLMMEEYGQGFGHIVQEVRRRKILSVDGVDIEITGKPDWIDVERKLILDFKSAKSINVKPIKEGGAKEGHREQVSIYRWLCWGGTNMDTGEVEHIELDAAGILYFDMAGTRKVGVEMMDMEMTEWFLKGRLRPFAKYEKTNELPPFWLNDKGVRHHFCRFCALKEICDERGE